MDARLIFQRSAIRKVISTTITIHKKLETHTQIICLWEYIGTAVCMWETKKNGHWTAYILIENKILNAWVEEEKRWNELENGGSHKKSIERMMFLSQYLITQAV